MSEGANNQPAPGADHPVSILIVNQSFWPDIVATAQQAHDLAKYLSAEGNQVTVVASRSLYGKRGARLDRRQRVDGIDIRRVSFNIFDKRGLLSRAIDYVRFNIAAAWAVLSLPRHDVVICLTTPPFIALLGTMLKRAKGTKFVFWTMDLYPDLPVAAGIIRRGGLLHRVLASIDRFCLLRADKIVTLGRCMRDRIIAKGIQAERIEMINPWSDPEEIPDLPVRRLEMAVGAPATHGSTGQVPCGPNPFRTEWGLGDRFVIQYSGNFGLGHDTETVFGAMLRMKDDDGIRWLIVGDGVMRPAVEAFVQRHEIRNVVLKPYQPRSRLGTLITLGDVHLVLMVPEFQGVILPSKLYGVLAAGRPAIFVGPEGSEISHIIKEGPCGVVVPNRDVKGLVRVIEEIRRDPALGLALGNRGRRSLEARYSIHHACKAWSTLIGELTAHRERRERR